MIHRSPLPDVELLAQHLTDYVLARAVELGDKPALIDGPSGRTITYGALLQGVRALAGGLVARGFEPGQTLALLAPNLPEYAVVFHGAAYAGGVVTTTLFRPTPTARSTTNSSTRMLDCWSRWRRSWRWPVRPPKAPASRRSS